MRTTHGHADILIYGMQAYNAYRLTDLHTCTHMHICTYAHMHIHTYTRTYTHTHIHTYTHTYAQNSDCTCAGRRLNHYCMNVINKLCVLYALNCTIESSHWCLVKRSGMPKNSCS